MSLSSTKGPRSFSKRTSEWDLTTLLSCSHVPGTWASSPALAGVVGPPSLGKGRLRESAGVETSTHERGSNVHARDYVTSESRL